MTTYATKTTVSPERSRAEIEATLRRYGADQFVSGWSTEAATIGFRIGEFAVRLIVPLPRLEDFRSTREGRKRTEAAAKSARNQAERQRWRALALVIKAKLEAIESGVTTVETEFLHGVLIGGGMTVGQWVAPQLAEAQLHGITPQRLPGLPAPRSVTAEVVEP